MPRATAKKRSVVFPFDLLVLLVRANDTPEVSCMFCQQEAAYRLDNFTEDIFQAAGRRGGMLDMDAIWREAIHRQVEGNYTPTYYQVVCLDCCIHFAAIQLGQRRPIQYFLKMASLIQKQQGVDISLAILCTVNSFTDEGDLWAMNAAGNDPEAIMQEIKQVGQETARAEQPQQKESEEDWQARMQKRKRLLELRAQEIKDTSSLHLFLAAYQEAEQKEQQQGKVQQLVREIIYALFEHRLDTPEKEKWGRSVALLRQHIKEAQAEQHVLLKELGGSQVQEEATSEEKKGEEEAI